MSNTNTGLTIVVVVALMAIVFIGAYLLMGDFSNSSNAKVASPESQNAALQQELASLRQSNFDLSMQLSQAQSQINSLKSQNQQALYNPAPMTSGPNSQKCNNLNDDYDNTRQDIRDKKNDISNLEDEIAQKKANNESTTDLDTRLSYYKDDLNSLQDDLSNIKDDLNRYNC